MTNRDFDQSEAEVLAEFAGFEHDSRHIYIMPEKLMSFHVEDNPYFPQEEWKPWSLEAPMWQIQSLLDAVNEKNLHAEYFEALNEAAGYGGHLMWKKHSAPPEAICKAILQLEGD